MCLAVSCRLASVLPVMQTVAPASPSCSAIPRPIPRPAPVTRHTQADVQISISCNIYLGLDNISIEFLSCCISMFRRYRPPPITSHIYLALQRWRHVFNISSYCCQCQMTNNVKQCQMFNPPCIDNTVIRFSKTAKSCRASSSKH